MAKSHKRSHKRSHRKSRRLSRKVRSCRKRCVKKCKSSKSSKRSKRSKRSKKSKRSLKGRVRSNNPENPCSFRNSSKEACGGDPNCKWTKRGCVGRSGTRTKGVVYEGPSLPM